MKNQSNPISLKRRAMEKRKNKMIRLPHDLYDVKSIRQAVADYSEITNIAVEKKSGYSDVFFSDADIVIVKEFLNYALFLTIQSK